MWKIRHFIHTEYDVGHPVISRYVQVNTYGDCYNICYRGTFMDTRIQGYRGILIQGYI